MNWVKGFSATYYMAIVDRATWRDIDRIEIVGGSISRTDSNLIESADVNCVNYDRGEQWIRVYLDARQDGSDPEHVPMFTGLATSPAVGINGMLRENTLECYSVLKPADDIPLQRGWYISKGSNGAQVIKNQLLADTPAPVVIDGEPPALSQTIIAENNESKLSMSVKILDAMNWRFRIEGNGTIHITPKANVISASFDVLDNDAVEPKINVEYDWYSCPNVFMAVIDGTSYVAKDENPESPLSIPSRGREVWVVEESPKLSDGETARQYVQRRLKEEQTAIMNVSYNRRFIPDLTVGDYIRMNYPKQQVMGMYQIVSQSFNIEYGATVSEESVKVSDEVRM